MSSLVATHGSKGKDIATLLDYADTKKAIAKPVSEDDRNKMEELMGDSQTPLDIVIELPYIYIYINESGLY